jgi:hypothetical protein
MQFQERIQCASLSSTFCHYGAEREYLNIGDTNGSSFYEVFGIILGVMSGNADLDLDPGIFVSRLASCLLLKHCYRST